MCSFQFSILFFSFFFFKNILVCSFLFLAELKTENADQKFENLPCEFLNSLLNLKKHFKRTNAKLKKYFKR